MFAHLKSNIVLLAATLLLCCVGYPLVLLGVGKAVFPSNAEGSLIRDADGAVRGSTLIAQPFDGPQWFRPRPSAVSYNAAGSGGSNLGASNPALRERVAKQLSESPASATSPVPADGVTTSGSGLDPHITLDNARRQLDTVAAARAAKSGRDMTKTRAEIEAILDRLTTSPLGGLSGVPLVNVVELNRAVLSDLAVGH